MSEPNANMNAAWQNEDYDPRNQSAIPMMIEAGIRDIVAAIDRAAERIAEAIDGHG